MTSPTVLILGAGPTGMAAAIELRRAGLPVRIVDKADGMARWSQALVLQARTLEQFQRYGIAHTAVERGRRLGGGRAYSGGRQIAHFRFDGISSRYPYLLFLPQSETEAILNEHMESLGVKTERGVEATAVTPLPDGASVTLRHPNGHVEEVRTRWLLGCDGAHSTVRDALGIAFRGETLNLRFILGDLEVEGEDVPTDELVVHLDHGDIIFTGRLTEKLTRVIVVRHADNVAGDKERSPTALDQPLSIPAFQKALDGASVRMRVLRSEWMTPFHVNDRQAAHYRQGNIFLAGDASHVHSPVGGQGMNTGIQDVANLCWKIAAVERGSTAAEALLNSYEEERAEVGRELLSRTGRVLKLGTMANPLLTGLRDLLAPTVTGMDTVRQAVADFVSETAIAYRSSSAVHDEGGDGELRAGDRMPDLTLAEGSPGGSSLLERWTSGKPLAILLNGSDTVHREFQESLPLTEIMDLAASDLDDDGRRQLGKDARLFLVRPDGYIGYRGPLEPGAAAWKAYARAHAL